MKDKLNEIIQSIITDFWGHESWILIGNEQHKEYWWACIGDCSDWNMDFTLPLLIDVGNKSKLTYKKLIKASTFNGLVEKLHKELTNIKAQRC